MSRAVLLVLSIALVTFASAFNYVDGPVQLLDVNEDHSQFELVDEGLEFLRSIEAPFALVAVGGAAKSGKSSLLNQILNISNSVGFDGTQPPRLKVTRIVSAGFKPGTLGIFFWGRPTKALVDGLSVTVIFMDTEGLGSNENPTAYDQKLCLLTVLIASDFYYNVLNAIMKENVNLLHSAVQLYSLFQKDQLAPPFPHLFWVVQSYQFDLGSQTAEQYLEWALQPKDIPADGAASEDVIHFNEVVTALKAFPSTSPPRIMLMDFPKQGVRARDLARLGWHEFDPGFQEQLVRLKKLMLSRIHVKKFSAGPISVLARLIVETIVPSLNRVDTIIPEYLRQLAEDLLEKCFAQYALNMTKHARLPQRESHIIEQHNIAANQSLETFASNCTGGLERSQNKACYEELNQKVITNKELLLRQNLDENKRRCRELLDEEWNVLLRLRLCEETCDIRDYEKAKADHKRRYEAGCMLEPAERNREYVMFQRNRMKDNDERFAVKCAQRCFKTIVGTSSALAFCAWLVGKILALLGSPGRALSHVLTQVAIMLAGCTILLIASYMELVAFLPWTSAAFYVFPLLDIPLRITRAVSTVITRVIEAGPIVQHAADTASPLIADVYQRLLKASALVLSMLHSGLGGVTAIIASQLESKYGPQDRHRLQLFIGGAFVALVVSLLACMCRRQAPRRDSPRGFRVRVLE